MTYVIAEFGSNVCASLDAMKEAAQITARVGANAMKLQWTSNGKRMAQRRHAEKYADSYVRWLQWPAEWHAEVAQACQESGVDYMCTVFLPEDVPVIAPYVARFKIASFEALDELFLRAHEGPANESFVSYHKPIIVSTGTLFDYELRELERRIVRAWSLLRSFAGEPGTKAYLLHCVSAYPAPLNEMNLAVLRDGVFAGLSDHSPPEYTITGALAVAAGASIVEAHIRIPGQDPTAPDYPHAMTVTQFTEYVRHIRTAEIAMGDGIKKQQPCERDLAAFCVHEQEGATKER